MGVFGSDAAGDIIGTCFQVNSGAQRGYVRYGNAPATSEHDD